MSTTRRCRKARSTPIKFDCKLGYGHEGKCSPYTLRPLSAQEWAALGAGPAGWFRGSLLFPDGDRVYLGAHKTEAEAAQEIATTLAEFAAMRERRPELPERLNPCGSEVACIGAS